jgi:serine/threonine protein kinase
VDVWACGVTLYNMISGNLPYDVVPEGNYLELYDRILHSDWIIPKEATPDIADLLKGMLEKKPDDRLDVNNILQHRWTSSHYHRPRKMPPILAYRQNNDSPGDTDIALESSLQAVGCETTMIPYMSQMFKTEIEQVLQTKGPVSSWMSEQTASIPELNSQVFDFNL